MDQKTTETAARIYLEILYKNALVVAYNELIAVLQPELIEHILMSNIPPNDSVLKEHPGLNKMALECIDRLHNEMHSEIDVFIESLRKRLKEIASLDEASIAALKEIEEAQELISKYEAQREQARNNREYDTLTREIELQQGVIEKAEKRIEDARKWAEETEKNKSAPERLEKKDYSSLRRVDELGPESISEESESKLIDNEALAGEIRQEKRKRIERLVQEERFDELTTEEKLALPVEVLEPYYKRTVQYRIRRMFRTAEMKTVRDLVRRSRSEFIKVRTFGRISLDEVERVLDEKLGLHLGMDV